MGLIRWLSNKITKWLLAERTPNGIPLSDFKRIGYEVRLGDVILVEGRSHVSDVIKNITNSPWTHAALYIGRIHDIEDENLRDHLIRHHKGDVHDQLIIEALMGEGAVANSMKKYKNDHLRLCRPKGLSHDDMQNVAAYMIQQLGTPYDVRQLLDLARFMLPYAVLPRRWRSSLFRYHVGTPTRTVCSSMIASAFHSVQYPVLPVVHRTDDGQLRLYKRNTRLFTPCDFDYSPYFDIIKYPYLGFDNFAVYRSLPWNEDGVICNGENDCFVPVLAKSDHVAEPTKTDQPRATTTLTQTAPGKTPSKKKLKPSEAPKINLLANRTKDGSRIN